MVGCEFEVMYNTSECECDEPSVSVNGWSEYDSVVSGEPSSEPSPEASSTLLSPRQTMIQVNFMDLCGSHVYVVCFISRPPNCVRKLLCNLRTLK